MFTAGLTGICGNVGSPGCSTVSLYLPLLPCSGRQDERQSLDVRTTGNGACPMLSWAEMLAKATTSGGPRAV